MPNYEGTSENCRKKWIIPLPNEGFPDDVYSSKEIIEKVLSSTNGKKNCDCMWHYKSCKWMLVERKGIGKLNKAIEQLRETYTEAKNKFNVIYFLVIYSGKDKGGKAWKLYNIKDNKDSPTGKVIWNIRSARGGPIEIDGKLIWAIKEEDIEHYRKRIEKEKNIDMY